VKPQKELLEDLDKVRAELERRKGKTDPWFYIPQKPSPKQKEFLELDAFEAFYGGAVAGGKTSALLMAALQYAHVPGYAALIIRRKMTDQELPGAILDRAHEWLSTKGVPFDEHTNTFQFPSGATLTFGYLDRSRDRFRYQGAELQFIGFDELTQFPELWYTYLLSRLRQSKTLATQLPLRARATGNPGGIGHHWVKQRFIDEETRGPRAFVPARLEDNPHVDESYRTSLAALDPETRRQLEEGIWIADSSGLVYGSFDSAANIVDAAPDDLDHFLLALDFGVTASTAFTVLGWRENDPRVWVVFSEAIAELSPGEAAEHVRELGKVYDFVDIVGDVGGLGKAFVQEMRVRFHLPIKPAQKKDKRGFIDLLNGELARRRLLLVRGGCPGLIKEWRELPWDETRMKPAEGFSDHEADATLYGWRACRAYGETPKEAAAARKALKTAHELFLEEVRAHEAAVCKRLEDDRLELDSSRYDPEYE
jgi:hypothetical protein